MQFIQGYNSSDEELNDSCDEQNEQPKSESPPVNDFFSLHTDGFVNQELKNECETAGPTKCKHGKQTKHTNSVIDRFSGNRVYVPDSDYWSSIDVSSSNKETSIRGTDKPKNKINTFKRTGKFANIDTTYSRSTIETQKRKSPGETNKSLMVSNSILQHSANNDVPRKLYIVHGKIQPFLNAKNIVNKPPSKVEKLLLAHQGAVNKVRWNKVNYSHLFLSASMDNTVKVWNVWTQADNCVATLTNHNKAVRDAAWSHCGRQILSCSYDRTACLTDVETGKAISEFKHNSFVTCGKFHPENTNIFVTGEQNTLRKWDCRCPSQAQTLFLFKDKIGQVQDLVFTTDGNEIFSCSDSISRDSADRNIIAWDTRTGVVLSNQIYQERYSCTRMKIHRQSRQLLVQSQGGYIGLFSTTEPYKMNKSKRFEGHKVDGYGLGFDISQDGSIVYSASSDGKFYCYNFQTSRLFRTLNAGFDVCMDIAAHPVLSNYVVCCGWNGQIQVWH